MSPSPCNKLVFIGSTRKFLFLKMEKFEKFIEGVPPCQHDIFIAKWSEDGKNIGVLTQKWSFFPFFRKSELWKHFSV